MSKYTRASEERIKLLASTLANAAVGAFITGVIGPIIAAAVNGTKIPGTYSAMAAVMLVGLFITGALAFAASVVLGTLEAPMEGSEQ